MTVTGNNLTGIKSVPESCFDQFCGRLDTFAVFFLELESPVENFLICKAVQRAGQTVQTCGVCIVRIRQSGVYQVSRMGGYVAASSLSVSGSWLARILASNAATAPAFPDR